jgi:hypothetical protein
MNLKQFHTYINKKFSVEFSLQREVKIRCPQCLIGKLDLKEDNLQSAETAKSKALHAEEYWEPEMVEYEYSCVFYCKHCGCPTYSCGVGYLETLSGHEDTEYGYETMFRPKFFVPTIPLIEIHKNCPESVRTILFTSFAIAWSDVSAACNKLRIAIEQLIAELHPELNTIPTLHHRIEALKDIKPDIYKLLMAIKFIGNEASHDDILREYDLAFGYEVIELLISNLFDDSKQRLLELVDIVNQQKGTPIRYD